MKKALRKNFYMEIRHSLGRFLSIFFIVAIGCAFFSGIRASEPDMRYSGDAYFDEKNLMDIQVMSTMGLTEDDLDAIRAVDGVLDAEGSYATDVLCTIRGNQVAVHVMALQDKMNQVQLEDGRLPEKENECVIDADYLDGKNSLEEAVTILKRDTRHFAKRQLTWFRRERDVTWLDIDGAKNEDVIRILTEQCVKSLHAAVKIQQK